MQHPLYIFVRERERGPLREQRTQGKPHQKELGGPQRERCPVEYGKGAVRPQGWGGVRRKDVCTEIIPHVLQVIAPFAKRQREKDRERKRQRERDGESDRQTER